MKIMNNNATGTLLIGAGGGGGYGGISLFNKNLNARYLQAHNEASVDIFYNGTLRFATSGIGATVYGQLDTTQLTVSGVSTFTGAIDANGDLDVDGQTELDNLNVAGVSTFSDDVKLTVANGNGILLDKSGSEFLLNSGTHVRFQNNNEVNTDDGKIGTALFASGLNIVGSQTVSGLGRQIRLFGNLLTNSIIPTVDSTHSIGLSTNRFANAYFDNLDVDGQTEIDDLNVAGISTVVGVGTFKEDVYIDKKLYVAGIEIGGPGGPGIGTDITTRNLKVTGIATVTGNTDLNGNLDVDGYTELDDLNVAGVSTFNNDIRLIDHKPINFGSSTKSFLRYNNILNVSQWYNGTNPIEIGYRGVHLMWLSNRVLSTKLAGVHVHGNVESDTLTVGINTTATNPRVTVGGNSQFNGNLSVGAGGTVFTAIVGAAASVGIGDASPSYMLDVAGAINSQTDVKINGVSVTEQALNDAVAMAIALG
jgi:hypothetical protein